jgi:putative peptide zinc metalloprotease protein
MVMGPMPLPPLRQDLALHPGADAPDGSPTWTLHDPASNRFFALSWPAFELLSRWALGSVQAVVDAVNRETTLTVGEADLIGLLQMLQGNHLLVASGAQDTQRLAAYAQAAKLSAGQWLLKNYLFFRLPLLRPMRWLQRMSRWVRWAYSPAFWAGIAALSVLGLALASRRWDEFTHTFTAYASWDGLLAVGLALSVAKVLHELGHAFTATRFGCRVPTMGVAFLVMWPVLYTDTNEAWKLTSRRQRLAIGAAGMLSELALAAVALVVWSVLPDTPAWGPVRSGAFLLATTTWLLTVAINASPFMRFDGYFLLSDAVNMPNLHDRAFALARWWLRERLFGLRDAPPERFAPARQRWLIAFAFATWTYRLVLFFGIALLVYHAFFKALGLVLMAVELGWFIARPVWREVRAWWQRREGMRWNRASRRTALMAGAGLLVLLWPWRAAVHAPAVLGALQSQALYAPYAAQVAGPLPRPGQAVRAGQPLAQLRSPELMARLAEAQAREQQLQWQLSQQPFDERLMEAGAALRKRWEAAAAEVAGLHDEIQRLQLTAPFDGTVAEANEEAPPGAWIPAGERLLQLIGPQGTKADAYVDEAALSAIAEGQHATFVPASPEQAAVQCTVARIDAVQLAVLDTPAVASPYGGGIPAQRMADGRLQPLQPTFHVRLEQCDRALPPRSELAGVVRLQGERRSLVERGWRWVAALWQREAAL